MDRILQNIDLSYKNTHYRTVYFYHFCLTLTGGNDTKSRVTKLKKAEAPRNWMFIMTLYDLGKICLIILSFQK